MKHFSARTALSFVLLIYLVTAGGHIDTVDADPSVETAYALLRGDGLVVHPERPDPMLYRQVGKGDISKMGWVLPFMYLPYVAVSKFLAPILPFPQRIFAEFLISFVNVFLTLAILILVYVHLRWSGHKTSQATLLCVILGLGTLLFPYAKTAHREPLQALLLTALAVAVFQRQKLKHSGLWVGGIIAMGFLTKAALIVPMIPLAGYYFFKGNRRDRVLLLVAPLLAASLQAAIGQYYYGSPLKNGYSAEVVGFSSQVWSTPLLSGLYEQWFSWDTGLIPHCPLVLVALLAAAGELLRKRARPEVPIVLLVIAFQTFLYAKWFSPSGGAALGPRYLVVVLPLFAFLLPTTEWQLAPSTQLRFFVVLLLSWSFFQQTVNASVKPQQYWSMRALSESGLPMPHWMANIELFFQKSEAGNEIYDPETFGGEGSAPLDLRSFKTLSGLNYWWLHASRLLVEKEALKKSGPKAITVGQVHAPG